MVCLAVLGLLWLPSAGASQSGNTSEEAERTQRAVQVLNSLMGTPDKAIPNELLERAEGMAVIPHVVKAALGIGGRWGKGLLSVRNENGSWSHPVFIDLAGGSFGFQIGGQATDIVLVFTDRKGVDALIDSKLKLGADASVAAGPVGRTASAGTDIELESAVYSYSRSKGLFAGVALDGAVISVDKDANHKVYGRQLSEKEILETRKASSKTTAPFVAALNRYSPAGAQAAQTRSSAARSRQTSQAPREIPRASIPKNLLEEYDRADKAGEVLHELVGEAKTGIPDELMERAYGIAVIPNVVKAALGIGGRWGKGLLAVRQSGKWSPAAYIAISGGSFGFQIGGQATDLVLVFTDPGSVDSLLSSKLKLGADASVAAGPVGRSVEAGTDVKMGSAIYSYSRSKGAFAGVALDGAVISMDDSANAEVYGKDVTGREILLEQKVKPTQVTQPFLAALREYSPKKTK
jgi:lipid-binding SYLF domain-containing protein